MKKALLPLLTLFILTCVSILLFCSRNVETAKNVSDIKSIDLNKENTELELLYQKEGFVSTTVFRVIIVSNKTSTDPDVESIKDLAKKRSLATLQKYIQSTDKTITHNISAVLRNLIENSGYLTRKDDISGKHLIYFFDIEKNDIKRYIDSIPER